MIAPDWQVIGPLVPMTMVISLFFSLVADDPPEAVGPSSVVYAKLLLGVLACACGLRMIPEYTRGIDAETQRKNL